MRAPAATTKRSLREAQGVSVKRVTANKRVHVCPNVTSHTADLHTSCVKCVSRAGEKGDPCFPGPHLPLAVAQCSLWSGKADACQLSFRSFLQNRA